MHLRQLCFGKLASPWGIRAFSPSRSHRSTSTTTHLRLAKNIAADTLDCCDSTRRSNCKTLVLSHSPGNCKQGVRGLQALAPTNAAWRHWWVSVSTSARQPIPFVFPHLSDLRRRLQCHDFGAAPELGLRVRLPFARACARTWLDRKLCANFCLKSV